MGVSGNRDTYFGVLIIRILLFSEGIYTESLSFQDRVAQSNLSEIGQIESLYRV